MLFRIQSFNKSLDMYNVISDTGESKCVTAYQIVQVMLNGFVFDNAKLTKKGFAINTERGTRYIQIDNLPKTVILAINNKLEMDRINEELKKQQMTQAIKKPSAQTKVGRHAITSTKTKSIMYRGTKYLTDKHLCRKFNRDVNTFRHLLSKGYSLDEALGLRELRPESEVEADRKRNKAVLDSMARERGEF